MKKLLFLFISLAILASCSKKETVAVDAPIKETPAIPPLSAGFKLDDIHSVQENISFQFQNTSVSALKYNWDFGTGDVSTEKDPAYSFPGCGPRTVILTATDAAGNQKSFSYQIEVLCGGKHVPGP